MELRKLSKTIPSFATALAFAAIAAAVPALSADPSSINRLIIKRDYKAAFAALAAQANAGDARAQYRLGALFSLGLGTKRDEEAASNWLAKSAASGNGKAALALKRMAVKPPVTPKKIGDLESTKQMAVGEMVAFGKLPPRPPGQPDWLTLASARNRDSVIKRMLEDMGAPGQGDARGVAVRTAALTSSGEALATLVAAGSDLNRPDERKFTTLMLAIEGGNTNLVRTVLQGKPDFNSKDRLGRTAIALAARNCQPTIMQMLLEAGAEFDSGSSEEPPLVSTVRYCAEWLPFGRFLAAADTNAFDRYGRSAAWYAAANGNLPALEKLADAGANLDLQDKDGFSPIHAAAANGRHDIVGYIISRGSPVSSESLNGTTPLMLAANSGCLDCVAPLLAKTKDINYKNSVGDTALMYAVRGGRAGIVKLLLANGANPNARNANDDTPMKLARRLKVQELELQK